MQEHTPTLMHARTVLFALGIFSAWASLTQDVLKLGQGCGFGG